MASDTTLRAIITVLDQTAAPLKAINERFAGFSAPLSRIWGALSDIGEETGLAKIGERAGEAFEQVRHLGEGLLEIAGPLAALGTAGSVAGLIEMAKSTAEVEEQLALAAKTSGLAAQNLAGWQYAAKLANVDTEQLTRGVEFLNRNIALAAGGKSKDVEAILSQMGISNTPGHLVSTADALKAVAAEAQKLVSSGHVQTANAMMGALFGERAGMEMLPLFAQGPDKILEQIKEARSLGLAPSDEDIAKGVEFEESYKKMSGAVDGLKLSIANGLFPALTPIVDKMTDWVVANQKWISTGINNAVTSLAAAIGRVDWSHVVASLEDMISIGARVVDALGGIGPVIGIVAAVNFTPAILAFGELGVAVASTALKFILFPAASFIGSLAALIPAIGSASDAFAAFDLVLDANPVGAVVLAIGALVAAGYEIYEHWQPIKAFFVELWTDVTAAFSGAWDKIKPIVDFITGAADKLHGIGGAIGTAFANAGAAEAGAYGYPGMAMPGMVPPLTQLPGGGPAGVAAGGSPQQSQAKVTLELKNVPPDAKTDVQTSGEPDLDLSVGYAMAF